MRKIYILLILSLILGGCAAGLGTQSGQGQMDPYANKVTRVANVEVGYSFPESESVWQERNHKLIAMESEPSYIEASIGQAFKQVFLFSFTNKFAIVANQTKAFDTIKTNPPAFFVRNKPGDIGIARLTVQKDKGRRFVWVVNRIESSLANFYPPEDEISFKWAKTQKGVYKVTVSDILPLGEYSIITPDESGKAYELYSFRIEN